MTKITKQETEFTITVDGQEIVVHYESHYATADIAHFSFISPYQPPRRIPVSETGYLSHFSAQQEVDEAPSVKEYAHMLSLAIMAAKPTYEDEEDDGQMTLF